MGTCFVNIDHLFSLVDESGDPASIDLLLVKSLLWRLPPMVAVEWLPEANPVLPVDLAQPLPSDRDLPVVLKLLGSCSERQM